MSLYAADGDALDETAPTEYIHEQRRDERHDDTGRNCRLVSRSGNAVGLTRTERQGHLGTESVQISGPQTSFRAANACMVMTMSAGSVMGRATRRSRTALQVAEAGK